jgi:hypothetical protein
LKVDVCGMLFDIIMRDSVSRDDGNYGKCDSKYAKIFIDQTMPKEVIDATLIHEWIHGVLNANGIDHTEELTCVIATELYRNGWRIRTIKDEDVGYD